MNEKEKNSRFPKRSQKAPAGILRNSLKILNAYEDCQSSILANVNLPGSEELNKLGKMLTSSIYAALQSLHDIPTRSFVAPDIDILFGNDWPGHPFRHRPLFWWRSPLEPDVTRMIGRACSSGPCGNATGQRALSFLRALQQAIPEKPKLPVELESASLEACCELVIQNNKRLDIVFQCKETGKAYILIEVKFGASLNNPLLIYERYMKKYGSDDSLLVILGCRDERPQTAIKRGWRFAHWGDFLRRWEEELRLSGDLDEDFSRLRSTLWAKLVR